jgi:uncharacterized membrane protein HdeD (DUF308 family)
MDHVTGHWWMFMARGLTSFALAVLLLLGPSWSSTRAIALAFGIYAVVDGLLAMGFVSGGKGIRRTTYVVRGALGVAAGAIALSARSAPTPALFVLAGAWGVLAGLLEMAFASRTWNAMPKSLALMVAGTVAFGFGVTLLVFPLGRAATFRAFFAVFALLNGYAAIKVGDGLHQSSGAEPQTV